MPVLIRRRAPRSPALRTAEVRTLAHAMLCSLHRAEAELSILLTDDASILELNQTYRGKARPTDVLSFPVSGPMLTSLPGQAEVLGDIVLSLDTAARQAKARGRPLLEEVRFLLAHGLLHLLGYDHDTKAKKHQMTLATRRLVRASSREPRLESPMNQTSLRAIASSRRSPRAPGTPRSRR